MGYSPEDEFNARRNQRVRDAAPDLLEALKELFQLAGDTRTAAFDAGVVSDLPPAFGRNDFADKARAAIAKAEGKPHS
jgi:hypothetical protein